MATTSAAYTPALNTLITALDPTAQWGNPAKRLQIQNASPFVLEITCNGEQFTIQSFTAQTLPLDGAGTTVTMLPTSGPTGSQGSITAVWMQYQQTPPMADGQLTGAAQYAQGLGQNLLPITGNITGPSSVVVNLNPVVRTLIVQMIQSSGAVYPTLVVTGNTTGIQYYFNPFYLVQTLGLLPVYVAIVPIVTVIDLAVTVEIRGGAGLIYQLKVDGDTALYPESTFYNGQAQFSTFAGVAGSHVLLNGPARLLSLSIDTLGAGEAYVSSSAFQRLLQVNVQGTASIGFPPNTLLAAGQTLTFVNAVSAACNLLYAYP